MGVEYSGHMVIKKSTFYLQLSTCIPRSQINMLKKYIHDVKNTFKQRTCWVTEKNYNNVSIP